MSSNEPSFDKGTSPWSVKEVPGRAIYISGEYPPLENQEELRARYAHQARHLAQDAFGAMHMDELLDYDARVVVAELAANALKYSGALSELDVVYSSEPNDEKVYVVAVNPAPDTEHVPGIEQMGRHVDEVGNDKAEHGRGLGMVDQYAEHQWNQYNVIGRDGQPQIITYAILHAGLPFSSNGDDVETTSRAA